MEEPQTVFNALYLGYCEVDPPKGIETVNLAIDLILSTKSSLGQRVSVTVLSNKIRVNTSTDAELMAEYQLKNLTFLGIGKDVKNCALIMRRPQKKYVAYVFCCEPSSEQLCTALHNTRRLMST